MKKEELIKTLTSLMEKQTSPLKAGRYSLAIEQLKAEENVDVWDEVLQTSSKITPIKAKDLLEKKFPPLRWVVDKLIPENCLTIISAEPESYKSWLMLDIAIRSSTGEKFLGEFITQKKKTLLIDEEESERILWERIKMLTAEKNLNLEILSSKNIKLKDSKEIIKYCLANNIELLMLDSLVRMHNGEENSSKDMNKNYEYFKEFKNNNLTIVVTHHNRKSSGHYGSPGDEMRGSSDILASVDCHLSLKKDESKNIITIAQNKLRVAKKIKPFIITIPEDGEKEFRFKYGGEDKSERSLDIAKEKIIDLLKVEGRKLSRKDILNALKNSSQYSVINALDSLISCGNITYTKGEGNTHLYSIKN